jgi:hypothetical protein
MSWDVAFHIDFDPEFDGLPPAVQNGILEGARLLERYGPALGRPHVDTLSGSRFANMKELRLRGTTGVWRVAFAFDPERQAILLVAGDKGGVSQRRLYKGLIERADTRFARHLAMLEGD